MDAVAIAIAIAIAVTVAVTDIAGGRWRGAAAAAEPCRWGGRLSRRPIALVEEIGRFSYVQQW